MKKLFRGDVLTWLDETTGGTEVRLEHARERAERACAQAQAGHLSFGEPCLETIVERVARLPESADGAFQPEAELRSLRQRLLRRDEPSRTLSHPLVARYRLPLPSRARLPFSRFYPISRDRFLLLVKCFVELPTPSGTLEKRYETTHRLYAMTSPTDGLREVFGFGASRDPDLLVHVLHDGEERLSLIVGERLYDIVGTYQYREICVFDRPNPSLERFEVRAAQVAGSQMLLTVEGEDDECALYRFDRDGKVDRQLGYAGSRAEALRVLPGDLVAVSDLFDVRLWPLGARGERRERDFHHFFEEYPYAAVELIAHHDGRLLLSNGQKVIDIDVGTLDVRDEYILPRTYRTLDVVDGHLICSAHDHERRALSVDVFRLIE